MRVQLLLGLAVLVLVGCATPSRQARSANSPSTEFAQQLEWQGRISVQVLGDQASSMSAGFSLRGDAKTGELDLYSPLGTTLAALQWSPQSAQLTESNKQQYFNSLAELTEKATGAPLPVDAIFGWLQNQPVQASGWQADLSAITQGSLIARRTTPPPEVTLRIKLNQ